MDEKLRYSSKPSWRGSASEIERGVRRKGKRVFVEKYSGKKRNVSKKAS